MSNRARKYTPKTLKRLFGLSGNQCAFPRCTKTLVNNNNAKDSNICHISAANIGGERYDPSLTDKQRADYSNLILLCIQHHDETNDVEKYPSNVLIDMKQMHESLYLSQQLLKNPSMLNNTINAISSINFEEINEPESLNLFVPENKIKYNSIKTNISLIQEYKVYHHKINSLYDELEVAGSIKKEKLLNAIRHIYLKIRDKYILDNENTIEAIKKNSDNIINDIYGELCSKVTDSSFWEEDITLGIGIIMVDAFLRCKILEEPPKNDN